MMLGPVLTGLFAACAVFLPRVLHFRFPHFPWSSPLFILGVGILAVIFRKYLLRNRKENFNYLGLSNFFIYIHSPSFSGAMRWWVRGISSLFLSLFGGFIGPEGAGVELSQAIQTRVFARTSRWFEQKRRTEVAVSLAAGVSAAFGAPFAGVLFPIELGIGGRNISSVVSAIVAFLGIRSLMDLISLETVDLSGVLSGVHMVVWSEWIGVAVLGVICGLAAIGVVRFFVYVQESMRTLFQTQGWMRILAGSAVVSLIMFIQHPPHHSPSSLLEQVLWVRHVPDEVALLFFYQILGLSFIVSGFGTAGTLWPIFTAGGILGYVFSHSFLTSLTGFHAVAGIVGASAFFAGVFATPLTAAVLSFELTDNFHVILPCLLAGWIARFLASQLGSKSWIEQVLETQNRSILEGKSVEILDAVSIRDAMVLDYETVQEQDSVSELHTRILNSRYPFLPVVNANGNYRGLLTVDMIEEAWKAQGSEASLRSEPLTGLMEAKDILYRSGNKIPTLQVNAKLSQGLKLFEDIPCVPVLGEDRKVVGLLFSHSVRLAYEREMMRRSSVIDSV